MAIPLNSVIEGDCVEVMRGWPSGCVQAIICDPPYGVSYVSNHRQVKHRAIANDGAVWTGWLYEAARVLSEPGCIVLFTRWDVLAYYQAALVALGLVVRSELVWVKNNWGMGNLYQAAANEHESMLFATKGDYVFANGRPTSVYYAERVSTDRHPTEKPLRLMRQLVDDYAQGIVLDPFCGVGSTLVACRDAGVPYVGIEIDGEYVAIARRRLRDEAPLING